MAYGDYIGNLRPGYCKASVHERGMGVRFYQCERKAVKDGYCKQHHPDAVAARRKASDERYEAKWKASPIMRLVAANEELGEAQKTILRMDAQLEEAQSARQSETKRADWLEAFILYCRTEGVVPTLAVRKHFREEHPHG